MPIRKPIRRHVAVRGELHRRVNARLARVNSLAQRTRMMIAKLDEQIEAARRIAVRLRREGAT